MRLAGTCIVCGLRCALSPSFKQCFCCHKHDQRISSHFYSFLRSTSQSQKRKCATCFQLPTYSCSLLFTGMFFLFTFNASLINCNVAYASHALFDPLFDYLYLVAYLSSYHEKAINGLFELTLELPIICLPHQDRGNPAKSLSQRHNV